MKIEIKLGRVLNLNLFYKQIFYFLYHLFKQQKAVIPA